MRKSILAAAAAIVSLSAMGTARASDHTGWYTNVGIGGAHYHLKAPGVDGHDSATGGIFNIGWRKAFVGVEAGYTDLGSLSYSDQDFHEKASAHGFTAGFDIHANVNEHVYLGGRAGAFLWKLRDSVTSNVLNGTARLSGTGWYAGLAAGWDIDRHWSVGGNFNFYRMNKQGLTVDTKMYTVTAEYRL